MEDITCQFCGEKGFDLIGLKDHLQRWCDIYDNINLQKEIYDKTMQAHKEGKKNNNKTIGE